MMRKKQGWGSCFGDFSDFSYFFPGLFRILGQVGELFCGFQRFQLPFLEIFPAVSLGLGSCFVDFSSFSYFFPGFFQLFRWVWGAVLVISAVSATFFQNFSSFWTGFRVLFQKFYGLQLPKKLFQGKLITRLHVAVNLCLMIFHSKIGSIKSIR